MVIPPSQFRLFWMFCFPKEREEGRYRFHRSWRSALAYPLGVAVPILICLGFTPCGRKSFAKPLSSSGLPRRSAHGNSSRSHSLRTIDSVASTSLSPKMILRSASRRTPRLGVLSLASETSKTHATRARSGQLPPAASATARSGSQTSASRSLMPSGIDGQAWLTSPMMHSDQPAKRSLIRAPSS